MTVTPSTAAMISARRAAAAAKEHAVEQALIALTRARTPLTITAVAARAGVSRSYLSRHPTLGPKIRSASGASALGPAPVVAPAPTVEAALRRHVRTLQAAHREELSTLRARTQVLERENALLRGELIATGRTTTTA